MCISLYLRVAGSTAESLGREEKGKKEEDSNGENGVRKEGGGGGIFLIG